MNPNFTYDDKLLDNNDKFTDDFYKRFTLRPFELELDEKIKKTYQFPTFYGDVTCAVGIFKCSYKKAQAIMPHPKMKPVILVPGKAIVAFSCYEYKNVMGVPAYNEIAMTIPVMIDPKINVPALPMIMSNAFKEFGYYVFSMPVTSLENQLRGRKIWGLPKVVERIDLTQKDGICTVISYEADGKPYFELNVPVAGKTKAFDVKSNLYSIKDSKLVQAETNFKAPFNIGKKIEGLPAIRLYDTPSGNVLKNLEIDPKPFQFRYAEHMTACFDRPNEKYEQPFSIK